MATALSRYSTVAIILHWTMAVLFVWMIAMGWWMADAIHVPAERAAAFETYQLHKSVGLTILALSVARLVWRLLNPPPELPPMKPWEAGLASLVHGLFYVVMIALPLSGWAYVSTGYSVPFERFLPVATSWFGLIEAPHLPVIGGLDEASRVNVAKTTLFAHEKLVWALIVLAVLHVAAALKHQFLDRDNLLARMIPFLARGSRQ